MAILANSDTKVMVQGITGREAASFTKDMQEYGTKVISGVTPGKKGQSVYSVPVFDTVAQAMAHEPVDAAIISVPPLMVKEAALESLMNGIKLLIIVTERVPRKDTVELLELARQKQATVIGPNTLGLISPGMVKLGMAGGPVEDVKKAYMPGKVGIASRSGGMTTEIANLLTTNGIGQSTCISVGGDPVVGSNFLDLAERFNQDPGHRGHGHFQRARRGYRGKAGPVGRGQTGDHAHHRLYRRALRGRHARYALWPRGHHCRG